MSHITVLCTRRHLPGSALIRVWHRAAVSHVALIDPEREEVIEAVWPRVRVTPLAEARAKASYAVERRIALPHPERAIAFARSQIGKRYDWKATIGVGVRYDMHDAERWNCVELIAAAVAAGGRQLFHDERHHRLWPGLIHLANFES